MKVKLLLTLVITVALATIGLTTPTPKVALSHAAAGGKSAPVATLPQNPPETIDGATAPEKIPDQIAYSLLFRFLSNRQTEAEKHRARAYLKMVFGPSQCEDPNAPPRPRLTNDQIEALMVAADDYARRVGVLDRKAKEIRDLHRGAYTPAATASLALLQQQKDKIIADVMASLPSRIGAEGADKLRRFMSEVFKRRVKIHKGRPANVAPVSGERPV